MKVAIALVLGLAALAASAPTVDDKISKTLAAQGVVTIIVSMANDQSANLRNSFAANSARYATREAKLNAFYNLMKGHADEVQAPILALLDDLHTINSEMRVDQIWMTNQIVVRNANSATVDMLRTRSEIAEMHQEHVVPLEAPRDLVIYETGADIPQAGEQWGILDIEADKVWADGNRGRGSVIANIDTGVRGTHEALRDGHRAEYGWYDPSGRTATPNDGNGHGTHTMGTIAGRANGIGVAPEAQWIACKGCSSSSCFESDLLACGQWVACPTDTNNQNPNCDMAPRASSNSWGGGQGATWYDAVIQSWRTAGIVPLFSSGNSGPSCGTSNSPSDSQGAIAVGSTVQGGTVSSFSSRGPTLRGNRLKPDIAAPGSSVVSAYYTSDTAYSTLSGTSMACPHVAGLTALLYSANPNLNLDQVYKILTEGAVAHTAGNPVQTCGGIPETTRPNNQVGYGRINAVNSVNAAKALL